MAVNSELARIWGSDNNSISLAPVGTTLPTDLTTALDAAFEDVGWIHSDGLTESLTGSVEKIRGWQGNGVVRTRMNEPGTTLTFTALESKALTSGLRYVESDVTTAAGVRKATRSAGQRIAPRAAVIDLFDSDSDEIQMRLVIPRLEVAPNGDLVYANSDIAGYPFIGEIIGDYDVLATDLEDDES